MCAAGAQELAALLASPDLDLGLSRATLDWVSAASRTPPVPGTLPPLPVHAAAMRVAPTVRVLGDDRDEPRDDDCDGVEEEEEKKACEEKKGECDERGGME